MKFCEESWFMEIFKMIKGFCVSGLEVVIVAR